MQIIVCIKQVLDTEEFPSAKVDPKTNTLIREGVPSIINPFDENVLEERRCCNSLTKTDNPLIISLEVKPRLLLKRKRKLIP